MTRLQNRLYWRVWGEVLHLELRGLSSRDANEARHAAHRRALGFDKGHLALTNSQLDRVLAEFRRLAGTATIEDGLQLAEVPDWDPGLRRRLLHELTRVVMPALGRKVEDAIGYAEAICADRFAERDPGALDNEQLRQLIVTLNARLTVDRVRANQARRRQLAGGNTGADGQAFSYRTDPTDPTDPTDLK